MTDDKPQPNADGRPKRIKPEQAEQSQADAPTPSGPRTAPGRKPLFGNEGSPR
jgi:hypothetical protein